MVVSFHASSRAAVDHIAAQLQQEGMPHVLLPDVVPPPGVSQAQAWGELMDQASVAVVCISEAYEQDEQCRGQVEHADERKKATIFVNTQRGYKASGGVGLILGAWQRRRGCARDTGGLTRRCC